MLPAAGIVLCCWTWSRAERTHMHASMLQLAEGFTLVEHMGRTYPQLFVYKCTHCNGAGTVTCPHCDGFKVKRATSHNGFRLSEQTPVGR